MMIDESKTTEVLTKLIDLSNEARVALFKNDYNALADTFPKISLILASLAEIISDQIQLVASLNAGFEGNKQTIYENLIKQGASRSAAYQESGRMVKNKEAEYILAKGQLDKLKIVLDSNRYLVSDIKARLDLEKSSLMIERSKGV